MTTYYADYEGGNNGWDGTTPAYVSGTTGPKKTILAAYNAATGDGHIVLAKRGMTHVHAAVVTIGKQITFGDYGSGSKPIIEFYQTAVATQNTGPIVLNEWTEVDPANPLTAMSGTGLWVYRVSSTTSQYVMWVRLGTIDPSGIGIEVDSRDQIHGATSYDYPTKEREWGSADSTNGYLWVYSAPYINPVNYYGAVYYQTLNNPMFITDERNNISFYSLDFRNTFLPIRLRIDADGAPTGHIVRDCDFYNVRSGWQSNIDAPSTLRGLTAGQIIYNNFNYTDACAILITGGQQGTIIANNNISNVCRNFSNGGIYVDNLQSASGTPLIIRRNTISNVEHGHFWPADGGAIEFDSVYADGNQCNIIAEGNVISNCFEAFHNNSGAAGVIVRGNSIYNCDRAYLESDAKTYADATSIFKFNTCLVNGYNKVGTYGGTQTATAAITVNSATVVSFTCTDNIFVKLGTTDSKVFNLSASAYTNRTEARNGHTGFNLSSIQGVTPFSLDGTDYLVTGVDSTSGKLGAASNARFKGTRDGTIVMADGLPMGLYPDGGALPYRVASGCTI